MHTGFKRAIGGLMLIAAVPAAHAQSDEDTASEQGDSHASELTPHDDESLQDAELQEVVIICRAVNDFGYVGEMQGTLQLTGFAGLGSYNARGDLNVKTWLSGETPEERRVNVYGSVNASYANLNVTSGAGDVGGLNAMRLAFQSSMSSIESEEGVNYQTDCSESRLNLPDFADLVPSDALLRFTTLPDGLLRAQIGVLNNGNVAITEPAVRVRIAGHAVTGTLYQSGDRASLQPYIEVDLPPGTLARCGQYDVELDLDKRVQFGPFDPFPNDSGQQATACLRWNTTITEDTLGTVPDPLIIGKSLGAIVSSEVPGRLDAEGKELVLCSKCHSGAGKYPAPPGSISPLQFIDGTSWSAPGGWAVRFQNPDLNPRKPEHLTQLVQRWQLDGAL